MVCLEKLMGEVLGHEGKHQIGSLWVWLKLLSLKKSVRQNFGIRKNRFACGERKKVKGPSFLSSRVVWV